MKKRYILLAFTLLVTVVVQSQTVQQYTMYNQNHYLINPAAAGNENFADIPVRPSSTVVRFKRSP